MPRLSLLALFLLVALVPAAPAAAAGSAAMKALCEEARGEDYRLVLAPEVTRQGERLTVSAVARGPENPWGGPVPVACFSRWTVSDPAAASLTADHSLLAIADDAVPGTTVRLTAEIDGKIAVAEFTVVARDAVVLTGHWREIGDAACPASVPPLRELRFLADGRFEATWTPFETYVDYWGTYAFDPKTGAISFTPTGGNHIPADADLVGRAALGPDGLLRLDELFFGSPRGGAVAALPGCSMIFQSN